MGQPTPSPAEQSLAAVRRRRQAHLERVARLRVLLAPAILGLRGVQRLCQALGVEVAASRPILRRVTRRFLARRRAAFEGYRPGPHDVIVCADIKSGTNWTLQMAHQIAHRGRGEYDHIHDLVAWPDARVPDICVPLADPVPQALSPTGLRVVKTHNAADMVPYTPDATYVCVVRDPKDLLVSSWHFVRSAIMGPLMPSMDAWASLYLDERALHGQWARFASSWWALRDRSNVLFLRFEEMKDDHAGTVRRIAAHMGVELDERELAACVERSSFRFMKAIDHKFYPGRITPLSLPQGSMVRSGRKGGAGEMLRPDQLAAIDAHFAAELLRLDSDLPYEAFFGPTATA